MLWIFSLMLMVLWLLGVVTGYTWDGLLHVLPLISVLAAILGGIRRRRHESRFSGSFRGSH
jgi:hypothetical protein